MKAFKDLSEFTFVIPSQQRGYKWTSKNVEELLKDLWEFSKQKTKNIYCLQPIAVVKNGECEYEVLDGQQRLTTLFLLYKYLTQKNAYTLNFERDSNECDKSRWKFLNDIDKEEKLDNSHQIDRFYITEAYKKIKEFFEKNQPSVSADSENKDIKQVFRSLLDASRSQKSVQVIWYETPKEKAHETFRNLNSGKISLTNTDLIKALLLNRVNGLPADQHETVARQFEEMEQTLRLDHFWHMLSSEVPKYPHTRMDLLFNVVANVKEREVQIDYRTSFRWFAEEDEKLSLEQKWQQVRHTFLRLYDLYMDMYSYHYIGFLTYYKTGDSIKRLHELISDNEKMDKNEFIEKLRDDIKKAINPNGQKQIEDYSYTDSSRKELRELFLLHNIETLLQRYQTLKNSEQYKLQHEYEQFPFELLYKQSWDIEHIASQTTNELKNEKDREDWLKSVEADYSYFKDNKNTFEKTKNKEDFDKLYEEIINYIKKENQGYIEEENKNNIGNLVLLDKHTNRSFHNSLFPRKRRIVIMADGLASENDKEQNVARQFIPICTKQCFTKAYNKSSDVKLGEWSQDDANEYLNDIKEKLNKYFTNEKQ